MEHVTSTVQLNWLLQFIVEIGPVLRRALLWCDTICTALGREAELFLNVSFLCRYFTIFVVITLKKTVLNVTMRVFFCALINIVIDREIAIFISVK